MTGLTVCLAACLTLGLPPDLEQLLVDAPRADDLPDAAAVYLRRDKTLTVEANGRCISTLRMTLKILTAAGRAHATQELPWTTPYQALTVKQARTVRADGRVVEVGDLALQAVSAGTYGDTFGDVVRYQLVFPYVEPGAVIDYEVTIADNRPLRPEGVADLFELQTTDPVQSATYSVAAPTGMLLASHVHGELEAPVVRPRNAGTETVWRAHGLPAIAPERLRPRDINQSLWVLVSATATWEAVAARYRELAAPAYVSHTKLQQTVTKLAAGAADPVKAFYDYVCTSIRYGVGPLEQRAPGVQPRPAYETFDQRVGDCKDQVTLLLTMLRQAGVTAWPALVRRQTGGPLVKDVPAMLQFDHVIVAVPAHGRYRWLDPTFSYGPLDCLPPDIQGAEALVVEDRGLRWVELPTLTAQATTHERSAMSLEVAADGTLSGEVAVNATGGFAQSLRSDFAGLSRAEAGRKVADALSWSLPNAGIEPETLAISPADDPSAPFRLSYRCRIEGYADGTQRLVLLRPAVFEQARMPAGLGGGERVYPLRLAAAPERRVNRLRFRFVPELRVTEVPAGRERRESFGWFRIGYRLTGDSLEYTREVELDQAVIPAALYGRWRAWLLDLADADRRIVVAERR